MDCKEPECPEQLAQRREEWGACLPLAEHRRRRGIESRGRGEGDTGEVGGGDRQLNDVNYQKR